MAEFEYAFLWLGQENGRPWGSKLQGFTQAPDLNLTQLGIELFNIVIAAGDETGTGKVFGVDNVLVVNAWAGAQLRLGTTAVPLGGYATVTSNTATTVTVDWVVAAAASGTVQGYIVRPDYIQYPEVRVLVPYQPEGDGSNSVPYPVGTVRAPGFTVPASITSYEDLGLFLPFTFLEGIASHGISEATDSYTAPEAHAATAVTVSTFDVDNLSLGIIANAFAGGYVRVTHDTGVSWARIASNTGADPAVFTLDAAGWLGIDPPTTPATWVYEAWVPHYANSPHAYNPGVGFRYPTNDMQPCVFGNGEILNLPRGVILPSYGDRFGPLLQFGWLMAAELGKVINLIHLSVNDTTLVPRAATNLQGFAGTLGWWDSQKHSDWFTEKVDGVAARLKKMVETIAPAALTAEGNTKPLRILGIVMAMGEGDAESPAGREAYQRTMNDLLVWARDVITAAGLSPYTSGVQIPVVHPLITANPWEGASKDAQGFINDAIREVLAADGFGATIDPEGSPKLSPFDVEHFSGQGEALNADLISIEMGSLVNDALSFGSEIITAGPQAEVSICNMALSLIGETTITSLDTSVDTSTQADLCSRFYPEARDSLLQSKAWSFALRRAKLVSSTAKPPSTALYSYVVPPDWMQTLAVLPPGATDDYSVSLLRGAAVWEDDFQTGPTSAYTPQRFSIEQAPAGHRVLFTNQVNAEMRYVAKVGDATRFPPMFRRALSYTLAALLAGSIVKGITGAQLQERMTEIAKFHIGEASVVDAAQRQTRVNHVFPWRR